MVGGLLDTYHQVVLLSLECVFLCLCFSVKVSRLKCFLLFSLGGHRSLLLAVLICLCAAFDGYVTMVDWMSCISSGLSAFLFGSRRDCFLFGWSPPSGFICGILYPCPHPDAVEAL